MQLLADPVAEVRRRRLLDHLLVAALERAVAVAEDQHLAVPVAEDLHLDMPGAPDEALEEDAGRPERGFGGPPDAGERKLEFVRRSAWRHPDAAAAAGRLQHHRVADPIGCGERLLDVVEDIGSGDQRHVRGRRERAARRPWRRTARAGSASGRPRPARPPRRRARRRHPRRAGRSRDGSPRRRGPRPPTAIARRTGSCRAPGPARAAPRRRPSRRAGHRGPASENTATVLIPMRRAVRMIRHAISPRLAISRVSNIGVRRCRIGVGSKPLHGLLICGQLEISDEHVPLGAQRHVSPGREIPSTIPSVPSGSTGTFMNQLMLETRSRLPRPQRALGEEVLDAGVLVAGVVSVAAGVRLLAAGAAERVVAAAVVGDDVSSGARRRSSAGRCRSSGRCSPARRSCPARCSARSVSAARRTGSRRPGCRRGR